MKKHMIGPYTDEDDMLCRDSQRIMKTAMAVIYDGLNCFAHKIGGRNGVLNWHKTFSKLHPETAHELYIVVLEREKISADDACTMFNAVMNTAAADVLKAMMDGNENLTRKYINILQRAGY